MAETKRTAGSKGKLDPGPYIARVISHLDPNFMGGLEVELLKATGSANDIAADEQTFKVKYSSPFFGQTPYTGLSKNEDYAYTQQAYGFWAVPPDIGSRVIVIFIEGQPNMGYYIACVPDNYTNFTVPDRGVATSYYSGQPTISEAFGSAITGKLVTGEINKKNIQDNTGTDPTKFRKPINHDWMSMLARAGLNADGTRGLTSSSARRDVPSMVTGISTPGPYDKRKVKPKAPYGTKGAIANIPYSRLGGTSFVMDDGDENFTRIGPASTHNKQFKNSALGERGGDPSIPHNELTRIRTRTGHQILLHNTEDLIYINHGSGNSWIQMSANGKIDIYSKDSLSVHSENDVNLTADRDINMQAGRNINLLAKSDIQLETDASIKTLAGINTHITSGAYSYVNSGVDHVETASNIHMNGPIALPTTPLSTHVVPGATATATASLHKRLPQHEPWEHHENVIPNEYTPVKTDRTTAMDITGYNDIDSVPDTFKKQSKN